MATRFLPETPPRRLRAHVVKSVPPRPTRQQPDYLSGGRSHGGPFRSLRQISSQGPRFYSGRSGALVSPTRNQVPVTLADFLLEADSSVDQELPASYKRLVLPPRRIEARRGRRAAGG